MKKHIIYILLVLLIVICCITDGKKGKWIAVEINERTAAEQTSKPEQTTEVITQQTDSQEAGLKKKPGFHTENGKKYYYDKNGNKVTSKMIKVNKDTYYCTKDGSLKTGWLTLKGKRYFFYDNYKMAKAVTLEQKYVINKKGQLVKTYNDNEVKARKAAEQILKGIVKKGDSKSEKLYKAYKYIVNNTSYNGYSPCEKGSKDWEAKCAFYTLTKQRGECYGFAAAFSYLAKVIGYEQAVTRYGQTKSASYDWAPHGWCEIKMDKKTYLFDPEIEYKNKTCGRLYKKQYSEVARQYKKQDR